MLNFSDVKARQTKSLTKKQAVLREYIHSLRGKFKVKPAEKPFAEWMAELNGEEKELEEAKLLRMERAGLLQLKRKSKSTG